MAAPVKVLIVDDSAVVRRTLSLLLEDAEDIVVVGTAGNPYEAAQRMLKVRPDVLILDIEMPRMDGLTFLRKLMKQHPLPVVICSSVAGEGTERATEALALGALEIIPKPSLGTHEFLVAARERFLEVIRAVARADLSKRRRVAAAEVERRHFVDDVLPPGRTRVRAAAGDPLILVGASTGGTEALKVFLSGMPSDAPPILIVQHMPEQFTRSFAARLDATCAPHVAEAEGGEIVTAGHVLVAPGGRHLLIKRRGTHYETELSDAPPVNRHRPSVDVLFRSAAHHAGANLIGVVLTGMGDDGARGASDLRAAGGRVFVQNEATSVVFGMPRAVCERGAADEVLPLDALSRRVLVAAARTPVPARPLSTK